MSCTDAEVKETLEMLSSRISSFSQLLEAANNRLGRTNAVDRETGEKLLLEAATEAETIHTELKGLLEERARPSS